MLNLRGVDLNLLTAFEAIYAERNLTRAADRIGMSQPAMSNTLTRLRVVMKDDLFVRTGNSMQPTPRARQLAIPVLNALHLIREGLMQTEEFDPETSDKCFKIAGSEHVDYEILPRVMGALPENYQHIKFETLAGNAADMKDKLKSGEVDILVDISPLRDEEFEVKQITHDSLVTLVRKEHPYVGQKLSMHQTLELKHVVLRARDEHGYFVERFLREHGKENNIQVRVAHVSAMPMVVAETDLVCTVPKHLAQPMRKHFNLELLDTAIPPRVFSILMMWHKTQTHDPGHRWLRAGILKHCRHL
jgi:DNA-binding transcriptional LysR family regulator